jgi:hypothetical protein
VVAVLPILGEPTTPTEPANGTLDDPAHGFDHKAFGMIGPRLTISIAKSGMALEVPLWKIGPL